MVEPGNGHSSEAETMLDMRKDGAQRVFGRAVDYRQHDIRDYGGHFIMEWL